MNVEEKKLIENARRGDNAAFGRLMERYDRRIMALALQMLGNREDAQDVVQEVFLKVFQKIHQFEHRSEFFTWLYRIAVNYIISYRKKRRRDAHRSLDAGIEREDGFPQLPVDNQARTDAPLLGSELSAQIESGLDDLSLMQRTVFVLRFFQEFKIKEIAHIIGSSEGTVKNYLFRSTQKMKKRLKPYLKNTS